MLIPLTIVLTVVYVGLSLYSRAIRRGKLEAEWDSGMGEGDREDFIRTGLDDYHRSFRRKLILLVYVVPLALIALLVYLNHYS